MRHHKHCSAFSLVELLIVMTIMGILITFAISATSGMLRANKISQAISKLDADLRWASIESVRTNTPIYTRLYRFEDPDSTAEIVAAYQFLKIDHASNSLVPLTALTRFEPSIVIHENRGASTLLSLPEHSGAIGGLTEPSLEFSSYRYVQFQFRPDGSTNLPRDKTWGLTIVGEQSNDASTEIPADYRALVINPYTGATIRY